MLITLLVIPLLAVPASATTIINSYTHPDTAIAGEPFEVTVSATEDTGTLQSVILLRALLPDAEYTQIKEHQCSAPTSQQCSVAWQVTENDARVPAMVYYKIEARGVEPSGESTAEVKFSVNVIRNELPVFQDAGIVTINEDSSAGIDLNNYFSDEDTLTFSVTNDEYLSATDNGNGQFTLTAIKQDYNGQASLQVSANDGYVEIKGTVSVNIKQVYDAPVLIPIEDQIVIAGQQFTLAVNANDVDLDADLNKDAADVLTFSDDTDLFNINKDTGAISFTPTEADVDDYNIRITVKDKGDYQDEKEFKLSIRSAVSPKASLSITEPPFLTGKELTFDGTLSTPFDKLTKFEFDFGDGTSYTETADDAADGTFDGVTTHTYDDAKLYTVSLTVYIDDDSSTIPTTILVTDPEQPDNKAPVASFLFSQGVAYVGESIRFDASESIDMDGRIIRYAWDFGDDNSFVLDSHIASHAYSKADTYDVTLTVTDYQGATDEVTHSVTIKNKPAEPVQKKRITGGGGGGGSSSGGGLGTDTWIVEGEYESNAKGSIILGSSKVSAKLGEKTILPVIIQNSGDEPAIYELVVDGLLIDAYTGPSQFELAPGKQITAYVSVMPQRAGESALTLGLLADGEEVDSASVLVDAEGAVGLSAWSSISVLLVVALTAIVGLAVLLVKKA